MDYKQLEELYSNNKKYVNELDPSSINFERLLIETIEWKIPHLMEIIPHNYHPSSVGEIGCFAGHLIGNISINGRKDFKACGYDINPNAVDFARSLYPKVSFFSQDCFSSGDFFDLLILSDIVEHIENDEAFLKQCHSVSKFVLLNLPLEKSIASRNRKYGFDDPSGHLRAYGIKDAESLIERSGYRIINKQILSIVNTPTDIKRRQIDLRQVGVVSPSRLWIEKSKSAMRIFSSHIPMLQKAIYGCNLFAFLESYEN